MPTAAFTTLGCKVNQYETQAILESFESAGFAVVPFGQAADVVVVNTCSVTSVAEAKSRYTVRKALRDNPTAKLVVTGCAAQMSLNKAEVFDGADVLVPNPEKLDALGHLFRRFPEFEARLAREARPTLAPPVGRTRATLKVQDGCDVFCSYCSIPFTRPGLKSRPVTEVVEEARRLVDRGHLELVLTGVLIGAYGPATGSGGPDFESLVERVAAACPEARLRISSIEMRQVTPRLLELAASGVVVPHLHIPLQSGDDGVLRDMNRPYSQRDYLDLCAEARRRVPDLAITTDILVGFPTESEERFASSVHVCREVGFLKAHVFPFSPRFGTPADGFGDPVSPEEKRWRSHVLAETVRPEDFLRRFLGRTVEALVEVKRGSGETMRGMTPHGFEVSFAGSPSLARSFARVRVDEVRDGVAFGELAHESRAADRRVLAIG